MAGNTRSRKSLSTEENSGHQKPELKAQVVENGPTISGLVNSDARIPNSPAVVDGSIKSSYGTIDALQASAKKSSGSVRKRKKVSVHLRSNRYPLRSSIGGGRVLRSLSNGPSKTTPEPSMNPTSILKVKRKRRRKLKKTPNDEFTRARKRVRYMLTRMNYEQSLIDAYAGEGWRGQSSEKIKPEKELQRAQSEIMRCKLKIRDVFQCLDSLMSEGRLDDSLYDSEGEIDSEDIFCAKCGAKDLSADNDIILCDGVCNRGFHQKCLNPPLLNENIPQGDEGWLCHGCDCKVDCLKLLNEFQGTDLSSEDNWEKVFPEAAAVETGDKQYDDLGLPSDDSEDEDYDPESREVSGEVEKESSSSEDSDSTSSSDDTEASNHDQHHENFGFPSDDSEDNDYDPDNPDVDENLQEDGSDSDEPEFTSDSMVSRDLINDPSEADEASKSPSTSNYLTPLTLSPKRKAKSKAKSKPSIKSVPHSLIEPDMYDVISSSSKRQRERLDYKRLYDETYGNSSSDSSDDEDFTDMKMPKKVKNGVIEDLVALPKGNARTIENVECSKSTRGRRPHGGGRVHDPKLVQSQVFPEMADSERYSDNTKGKLPRDRVVRKSEVNQSHIFREVAGNSPHRRPPSKLCPGVMNHKHETDVFEPDSNGNKADTSAQRRYSGEISQKLREFFRENQYPSRDKKESFAQELGITPAQVAKWFDNARHSFRVSAKESSQAGVDSPGNAATPNKSNGQNIKSDAGMCSKKSAKESSEAGVDSPGNAATPSNSNRQIIKSDTVICSKKKYASKEVKKKLVRVGNINVGSTDLCGISDVERGVAAEITEREKLVIRELRKTKRGK